MVKTVYVEYIFVYGLLNKYLLQFFIKKKI